MNNSQIAYEEDESPRIPVLREHEAKVVRILEAIRDVHQSKAWSTLKEEVFDSLVASIEKKLQAEAKSENPDTHKLNRLAGELKWAEKYADLSRLGDSYSLELQRIRTNQHANPE